MEAVPFVLRVDDAVLGDVRLRLSKTRRIPLFKPEENYGPSSVAHFVKNVNLEKEGNTWAYGIDHEFIYDDILHYFENEFLGKWRELEGELNQLSQFTMEVEPGYNIHYIHEKCGDPSAVPIILCHGWPSTCYDFYKVVPLLRDLGFDVVVPSIPGFGFSTGERGVNAKRTAVLYNTLMTAGLGYDHYVAQGGDWGTAIATALGQNHSKSCVALHFNPGSPTLPAQLGSDFASCLNTINKGIRMAMYFGLPDYTLEKREAEFVKASGGFFKQHTGYSMQHITKPDTLGYGLNDSIAGLTAWIAEKFFFCVDAESVGGDIFKAISRDEVLTTVLLFWASQSITTSLRFYREVITSQELSKDSASYIDVPTGALVLPAEPLQMPKALMDLTFDLQHFTVHSKGGHFAPLEVPKVLAHDVANFVKKVGFRKCVERSKTRNDHSIPLQKLALYSGPLIPLPFIAYTGVKFLLSKL